MLFATGVAAGIPFLSSKHNNTGRHRITSINRSKAVSRPAYYCLTSIIPLLDADADALPPKPPIPKPKYAADALPPKPPIPKPKCLSYPVDAMTFYPYFAICLTRRLF